MILSSNSSLRSSIILINRYDDVIWEKCSAVFVPNYTMGVHLAFLQTSAVFYAPFAEWSFHDLVKFRLEKRVQVRRCEELGKRYNYKG